MIRFLLRSCVCGLLFFSAIQVSAQQEVIDQIREQTLREGGPDRLGAGYAALINFAVNPDISAATYNIKVEGVRDPSISAYRLPLRYVFTLDNVDWRPLVQANFAYLTQDAGFDIDTGDSIDAKWRTYGGSLGIGAEIPLSNNLLLVPIVDAGLARIESDADYHGVLSNVFLKPALDGLVFNWDADAWVIGAALGVSYRRAWNSVDLDVQSSLTYNYIKSYDSSSDLIEFDSQMTTFDINVDAVVPTGKSIAAYPIALVGTVGYTSFLGPNRDELGFQYFFEGGWPWKQMCLAGNGPCRSCAWAPKESTAKT